VSVQQPELLILLCQVQEPLEVNIIYRDADVVLLGSSGMWKNGGSMFLRNVCVYLQVHMALLPRRPTSTSSLL
jgi:hypothetical protein